MEKTSLFGRYAETKKKAIRTKDRSLNRDANLKFQFELATKLHKNFHQIIYSMKYPLCGYILATSEGLSEITTQEVKFHSTPK